MSRSEKEKATQIADIIVPTQIDKQKIEIAAEAIAEQTRRHAKGDADAIYMKMEAQAKGIFEILSKQAVGFEKLVEAAGNDAQKAVMMMIVDKLPELVKTQVEAIKNLKIDKVTVWDTGGKDGKGSSTANFFSSLMGAIPPLQDLFKQAGMELPDFLKGSTNEKDDNKAGIKEKEPKAKNKDNQPDKETGEK